MSSTLYHLDGYKHVSLNSIVVKIKRFVRNQSLSPSGLYRSEKDEILVTSGSGIVQVSETVVGVTRPVVSMADGLSVLSAEVS